MSDSLAARLIGTWELLTRVDRNEAGEVRLEPSLGSDPIALLFFDRTGHFAAQFMKRDRSTTGAAAPDATHGLANNSRAQGGYDAYFGTYQVDESSGNVTTLILGSLSPENVGQVYIRHLTANGNDLTLRLSTTTPGGEPVTRTLRWKKVG